MGTRFLRSRLKECPIVTLYIDTEDQFPLGPLQEELVYYIKFLPYSAHLQTFYMYKTISNIYNF